jgi:hypothetical protein
VDLETKRLDRFHVKEHIQEAAHDIAAGNILRSMQVRGAARRLARGLCGGRGRQPVLARPKAGSSIACYL